MLDLSRKSDTELADWHGDQQQGTRDACLAEHEWQRRIADRQIVAAHATARRAAAWGALSGIAGTVVGALLTWVLTGQSPPDLPGGQSVFPPTGAAGCRPARSSVATASGSNGSGASSTEKRRSSVTARSTTGTQMFAPGLVVPARP